VDENPPMPQVELSYVKRPVIHWYQRRCIVRPIIFLALVWLGWTLVHAIPPIWYRYRCFRLQQQAIQFPTTPDQILLDFSPSGFPVSHIAASVVQFQNELWASRSKAGLGTLTSSMLASTPVFCHSLKTPNGSERVIQIYAQLTGAPGGGQTVSFLATSSGILNRKWIVSPPKNPGGIAFTLMGFATAEIHLAAAKSLTISGGMIVSTDQSIAEITLAVDGQIYPIRIHLGDNFAQGPVPRMAMEGPEIMLKTRVCTGLSSVGFFVWPVAPAPAGN
jgi:hypothetical protein